MSIGQVLSSLLGSHQPPGRTAVPPGVTGDKAPLEAILEAEIVQLSLHSDGIWHPITAPESVTASTQKPRRHQHYIRQLASTGVRVYLPTGQVQVRTPSVGLRVDMYV